MKAYVRSAMIVLALSLAWGAPLGAQPPATGALERGKLLYETYCAFCHGVDGRAETPVAHMVEPPPRNFADPIEMARVTYDRMHDAIKRGRPGTAMASWGQVLTEPQIGDIIDYIQSLLPRDAPRLSAEQLSREVGRRIYEKDCAMCHGADGTADTDVARVLRPRPVSFADPIEMARVDDGRLYAAIKLGRPGTAMGGWGELLSPAEIIDLMRYIRSLTLPPPAGMTRAGLDVLVGERIYQRHCAICHGERGDGDTPLGRTLVPRPRDFTDTAAMAPRSDAALTETIIHGSPGTAMAAWGGILNRDDVRRVLRFIRQAFSGAR